MERVTLLEGQTSLQQLQLQLPLLRVHPLHVHKMKRSTIFSNTDVSLPALIYCTDKHRDETKCMEQQQPGCSNRSIHCMHVSLVTKLTSLTLSSFMLMLYVVWMVFNMNSVVKSFLPTDDHTQSPVWGVQVRICRRHATLDSRDAFERQLYNLELEMSCPSQGSSSNFDWRNSLKRWSPWQSIGCPRSRHQLHRITTPISKSSSSFLLVNCASLSDSSKSRTVSTIASTTVIVASLIIFYYEHLATAISSSKFWSVLLLLVWFTQFDQFSFTPLVPVLELFF